MFWNNGTSALKLTPMPVHLRDPEANTGNPTHYYIHGANLSGVNSYILGLNAVPSASGTNDIMLYGKQLPLTMVSGGQAPEVHTAFQDALPAYAEWMIQKRRGRDWQNQANAAGAEWERWIQKAQTWTNPLMMDFPTQIPDIAGLTTYY